MDIKVELGGPQTSKILLKNRGKYVQNFRKMICKPIYNIPKLFFQYKVPSIIYTICTQNTF